MLLLPITGIATMLGGGYGLTVSFIALVVGHIAAALFHHFVRRDRALRRILGSQ